MPVTQKTTFEITDPTEDQLAPVTVVEDIDEVGQTGELMIYISQDGVDITLTQLMALDLYGVLEKLVKPVKKPVFLGRNDE